MAILQQANSGSKEAQEMLQQENELRTETGQPTVQEALKKKMDEAKTKDILQNGKVKIVLVKKKRHLLIANRG